MSYLEKAIEAIEKQQPKERTPVWMVGEQLKDILRDQPEAAELVCQDIERGMTLTECEKKIKEYADKHKTGNFACVIPSEADRIIREYYGIPIRSEKKKPEPAGETVDLEAFF